MRAEGLKRQRESAEATSFHDRPSGLYARGATLSALACFRTQDGLSLKVLGSFPLRSHHILDVTAGPMSTPTAATTSSRAWIRRSASDAAGTRSCGANWRGVTTLRHWAPRRKVL